MLIEGCYLLGIAGLMDSECFNGRYVQIKIVENHMSIYNVSYQIWQKQYVSSQWTPFTFPGLDAEVKNSRGNC